MPVQPPPLGLYIHLPWCERKCPYCDFNSHESNNFPEAAYVDALLLDLDRDVQHWGQRTVETLFIGGGTPSLFSAEAIQRLMQGIGQRIALSPDLEATMEANPGSAEADKFIGFREAGINRLSIGVQSFRDEQLQALGRVHSAEQAHRAIEMAHNAGFNSFNIDLMHGLPGQSDQQARTDLQQAISHGAAHISWYQLTLEPNTVFYTRPPQLPDEYRLAAIQDNGELELAEAGYQQYEVSAYSHAGMQCRHNLNYWSFGDYLGIGAGAHGKITEADGRITRYSKTRAPADYLAASTGQHQAQSRMLTGDEIAGEFMLNALRLNQGFDMSVFTDRTGLQAMAIETTLSVLKEKNLLSIDLQQVKLTELGRRFLDTVVAEFFPG